MFYYYFLFRLIFMYTQFSITFGYLIAFNWILNLFSPNFNKKLEEKIHLIALKFVFDLSSFRFISHPTDVLMKPRQINAKPTLSGRLKRDYVTQLGERAFCSNQLLIGEIGKCQLKHKNDLKVRLEKNVIWP